MLAYLLSVQNECLKQVVPRARLFSFKAFALVAPSAWKGLPHKFLSDFYFLLLSKEQYIREDFADHQYNMALTLQLWAIP